MCILHMAWRTSGLGTQLVHNSSLRQIYFFRSAFPNRRGMRTSVLVVVVLTLVRHAHTCAADLVESGFALQLVRTKEPNNDPKQQTKTIKITYIKDGCISISGRLG